MSIEVRNVTKRFGSFTAVDDVSVTVPAGELVALLGPSGSGKTSLLRIIAGLEAPDAGAVLFEGEDQARRDVRVRRVGFVFQQFFLTEHVSTLDNVADALLYQGASPAAGRRMAAGLLTRVGLGGKLTARPTRLSGGERQRVAIARALAGDPAIVLADEPTGNLDQATGLSIVALLEELNAAGTTIVVVTHDQALASRLPRRVSMLDGRITTDTAPPATPREGPVTTRQGNPS